MSSPGTVEWFVERGVPEQQAAELAAIEAGTGHGCTPPDADAPVVEADELAELGDLDDDL
jgi:hypothetical protein